MTSFTGEYHELPDEMPDCHLVPTLDQLYDQAARRTYEILNWVSPDNILHVLILRLPNESHYPDRYIEISDGEPKHAWVRATVMTKLVLRVFGPQLACSQHIQEYCFLEKQDATFRVSFI
jgi:hypothetical protein